MKKIIYTFIVCFSAISMLKGQDKIVHGIIHTLDSIPLIGAEVKVKSTGNSVQTDSLGNFTIFCDENDKIKIRANGFYTENFKIKETTKLVAVNLKLKPGKKQRQHAIGYGHVSEEDLTSAISAINDAETDFTRFDNTYDLIRSMGVEVSTNGDVFIRGSKSFQGNDAALIVIDGAIADNNYVESIKPIQIESIDIIRDGTSSVYGSRGANGVVIINTKKGK